jgi:hypothetical protein
MGGEKAVTQQESVSAAAGSEKDRGNGEAQCRELARLLVGRLGLKQAYQALRAAMYQEALQRAGGSRRGAARLLGIDRRCVQLYADEVGASSAPRD